jgi:tetratricopeptide (TPR) repeat protein
MYRTIALCALLFSWGSTGHCFGQREIDLYNEGVRLHNSGELSKAQLKFEEALRKDPKFALAYWALSAVQADQGRTDLALASLGACIRTSLDYSLTSNAYTMKGVLWERKEVQDSAMANYVKALEYDDDNANARLSIIELLIDQDRLRAAYNELGKVQMVEDFACEIWQKRLYLMNALEIYGEGDSLASRIPKACIDDDMRYEMAQLSFYSGSYSNTLLRLEGFSTDSIEEEYLAHYYYMRGKSELIEGSLDSAEKYLNRAWNRQSNDADIVQAYADVLYEKEDYSAALAVYRSAIAQDPEDYFSLLYSALCQLWTGGEFWTFYDRAKKLDDNAYLHVVGAMKRVKEGQLEQAQEELNEAKSKKDIESDVELDALAVSVLVSCGQNRTSQAKKYLERIGSSEFDFRITKYLGSLDCAR